MKKHHLVYKITNTINSKYYIGVHSTNDIEDGYMGSGSLLRKAIKKYGAENFEREILYFEETREGAFQKEKELVCLETLNDNLCYNLVVGGNIGTKTTSERRELFSKKAAPITTKVHQRFNPQIKYVFVPQEKGVETWAREYKERVEKNNPKTRKGVVEKFRLQATRLCIENWQSLLNGLSIAYNNVLTHKQAVDLLFILDSKNLIDCLMVQEQTWD